jgi:starch synthase
VDLLQLHDHHAALTVALLAGRPRPATLLTVHNMAYQGIHTWEHVAGLGLPAGAFAMLDWYGRANALKAAILGADAVNAVSPTYAREIRDTDLGCGLNAFLLARGSALSGILNGIDVKVWDPQATSTCRRATRPTTSRARRAARTRCCTRWAWLARAGRCWASSRGSRSRRASTCCAR